MSGFTVDPSGLAGTTPNWGAQADQVRQIFTKLTSRLNAEGDCWGNDQAGTAFAGKYVGPALGALQYMDATNEGLTSMMGGIATWAANYVNSDQAARDDLIKTLGQ